MKNTIITIVVLFLLGPSQNAHAATVTTERYQFDDTVQADNFLFDSDLGNLTKVEVFYEATVNFSFESDDDPPFGSISEEFTGEYDVLIDGGRYWFITLIQAVYGGDIYSEEDSVTASAIGGVDRVREILDMSEMDMFVLQLDDDYISFGYDFYDTWVRYGVVDDLGKNYYKVDEYISDTSIYVRYTYNPVPVPSAALFLCTGLIGLAGFRIRVNQ